MTSARPILPFVALAACAVGAVLLPTLTHAAPAAGFDVETATRAWLDTLQGPARAKSDAYFEGGYWLPLWGALVSILADLFLLRLRFTARLRDRAGQISRRPTLIAAMTLAGYTVAGTLLLLPWAIWSGFYRERAYGLMNQTLGAWLGEQAISSLIGLVVTVVLFTAIYAALRRFPRRWWLIGTGLVAGFAAVAMLLSPIFIMPLFNSYTELPQGPLRERIVAMARAYNVPAEHIYVVDASKQSKRISANVSGLGPTIRISLNDNLLNRSTPQEVAAVMGHELGHYVLGHVWRIMAITILLAGIGLFLVSRMVPWALARWGRRWGVTDMADPASIPVLSIAFAVLGLLAQPAMNTLVRTAESEADAFGLDAAREPDAFASVAMKLSEYRKIEPSPVEEALFFDHPSGATRVRMAMQWKKDHVPGAVMVTPPPMPQPSLSHKQP